MIPRIIRRPEVLAKTNLSKTTHYNLEKSGGFPIHTMLTPRVAVWNEVDVDAWIAADRSSVVVAAAAPVITLRKTLGKR